MFLCTNMFNNCKNIEQQACKTKSVDEYALIL